jgi:hypothetical protein
MTEDGAMNSETVALKPCPFCGGEALFTRTGIIACTSCRAEGPPTTPEGLAEMWNTRIEAITRTVPDEVGMSSLERVARIIAPHHCEGLSDTVRNIAREIREELASHPDKGVGLREAATVALTFLEMAYIPDTSGLSTESVVETLKVALRSNQDGQ